MSYKQIDEQLEKFWDDFEDVLFCECLDSQKVGGWGFKPERLVELKKIIHFIYDQAKAEVVNEIANDIGLTGADKVIFVDRYSGESNIKGLQSVLGGK